LFHRNLIHLQNNVSAEYEFFFFDIRSQLSGTYFLSARRFDPSATR
jgi:hypothetical protein